VIGTDERDVEQVTAEIFEKLPAFGVSEG